MAMGLILSRFHKKRTCLEELEVIETKIKDIEKRLLATEQQQKVAASKFVVFMICASSLATAGIFVNFFSVKFGYGFLLFTFVIMIIFTKAVACLKKLIRWFYVQRMNSQSHTLRKLEANKQLILDEIMEKETYKVARSILQRFAPEKIQKIKSEIPVKKRLNPNEDVVSDSLVSRPITVRSVGTETDLWHQPSAWHHKNAPLMASITACQPTSGPLNAKPTLFQQRPRPILTRQSSFLDRLVENIVKDGPNHRYALICRNCHGHNGMALPEEFPYLSFRCCFCTCHNQAKRMRPDAPKISYKELLAKSRMKVGKEIPRK